MKRLLRVGDTDVIVKWDAITENELNANKDGEAQKAKPDVKTSEWR